MAASSNLASTSGTTGDSTTIGNSSSGISASYSAAIRAGWLARSLNQHASRLATNNNNNNNSTTNNNNNNNTNTNNSNGTNANAAAAQLAGMMDAAAAGSPMNDDFSFDDDDLWESVMNGIADPTGSHHNVPPHPLEMQFALGVNNYAAARNRYVAESNRQQRMLHFEVASRAFSQSIREPLQANSLPAALRIEPDDLLRIATLNSAVYHPSWADTGTTHGVSKSPAPSTRSSRSASAAAAATNSNNGIVLNGSGVERNQIAHVMFGASEGRAIRAEQPFPRVERSGNTNLLDPFQLSLSLSPTNSHDSDSSDLLCNTEMAIMQQQQQSSRSRAFGFRVAFDNPALPCDLDNTQVGSNLGGCFLIGVTSSTFTTHTESNTLKQSNVFWGIEDHGQIFEGMKRSDMNNHSTTATRTLVRQHQSRRRPYSRRQDGTHTSSSSGVPEAASFSADLAVDEPVGSGVNNSQEIQMNSHAVVFGVRDVVTVVCDLDNRSLTFWRNETLLGTLVSNLPLSGNLYPVAVPFNAGTTVAITSLKGDPLQL